MTLQGRLAAVAVLLLVLSAPALAVQYPAAGRLDSRIRYVPYESGNVVDVWTAPGAVLVIQFSPDEKVVDVAASDSIYLKAQPSANFLFFKPMAILSAQPIVVLTRTAQGKLRRYDFQFETRNSKLGVGTNVDYTVVFTYPHEAYEQRLAAEKAAEQKAAQREATARLHEATDVMEPGVADPYVGSRNYRYVARGDGALAPAEVWDNGYSTVFVFPGMQRFPAIFKIDPDGKEATANYSVHGETAIVPGTAPEWLLRDGSTVLAIYDLAYNPIGRTPGTHTISHSVVRVLRGSSNGD